MQGGNCPVPYRYVLWFSGRSLFTIVVVETLQVRVLLPRVKELAEGLTTTKKNKPDERRARRSAVVLLLSSFLIHIRMRPPEASCTEWNWPPYTRERGLYEVPYLGQKDCS